MTFVSTALGGVAAWVALVPSRAPQTPPVPVVVPPAVTWEDCRELPKSQTNRLLDMVADGRLTPDQAGALARGLACRVYKSTPAQTRAGNTSLAANVEWSVTGLLQSERREVRAVTAAAVQSGMAPADVSRLAAVVDQSTGASPSYPATGAGLDGAMSAAAPADDYLVYELVRSLNGLALDKRSGDDEHEQFGE